MKIRLLPGLLALLVAGHASALEPSTQGRYAIVHRDGHLTSKVMRMRWADDRWHLEDRQPDGSWDDITCDADCVLRESSPANIKTFFSEAELQAIDPSCVHNKVFAFCAYRSRTPGGDGGYLFVAFVRSPPIQVRLVRLPQEP